jgi:hypothetical protein
VSGKRGRERSFMEVGVGRAEEGSKCSANGLIFFFFFFSYEYYRIKFNCA